MRERGHLRTSPLLLLLLGTALAFPASAAEPGAAGNDVELGRRIYQEGILPGAAPLTGMRNGGSIVSGSDAACATCHRRSGMGSVEGDIQVPPVTGKALFETGDRVIATMDPRSGRAWNQKHDPYTDATLARAIRTGVNSGGRDMSVAMPRYALDDHEMSALAAYLKQLSSEWSPGVTADSIRFATVIAPGVSPERKEALIDTMRSAFAQKNGSTFTGRRTAVMRHMVSAAEMALGTERKWLLDVWELKGAPDTWAAQLDDHYRRQPVFALVSGVSNGTWQPVHDFCERQAVPCWFPSVDLPPATGQAFYPVYFSQGVTLEADVLASHLRSTTALHPRKLVQIYRDDDVGRGATQALLHALDGSGIRVENRALAGTTADGLRRALAGVRAGDAVMFWFRPDDLALLGKIAPPAGTAYFSARLAEDHRGAFPASWKRSAHLVYPYELPEKRENNLNYFHQWLGMRHLAPVDEPLQSEVYFAVNFLSDTLSQMLDNVYRDYLMERAENEISRRESSKAEEEEWARNGLWQRARSALVRANAHVSQGLRTDAVTGRGEGTTIYPRLSLGPTQRFASKGGYIVRFADAGSDKVVAESGWIIP